MMAKKKIEKIYKLNKKSNQLKIINDAFDIGKKTKVLIICLVYNHEKYISRCLDSMLMQRVNFNVKILIHDDNSYDKTKNIVDEYQKKYPNIISVIHQGHNLYSKENALLPVFEFLKDYLEGDYIALCEGDDYWIDNLKIQTQVDLLEAFPQCRFCAHKVNVMNDSTKLIERTIPAKKFKLHSGIISSDKFIRLTSIRYPFQTSSYFFRVLDFSNYLDNLPTFAKIMPTEDESLLLYFGQLGNVAYFNRSMSIYRKFSEGSWSNDHKDPNKVHQGNNRIKKMAEAVKEFDKYTNYRFHNYCSKRIVKHEFRILMNSGKVDDIFRNKQFKKYYKKTYPKDYWSFIIRRILK